MNMANEIFANVAALLGYEPTFHDARFIRFELDLEGKTSVIVLYYFDQPLPGYSKQPWDECVHILVEFQMSGIETYTVDMLGNWTYELTVTFENGAFDVNWTDGESGMPCKIRCAMVTPVTATLADRKYWAEGHISKHCYVRLRPRLT